MTFVSYAQNFEDVMLARAFKNLKAGFYIDVGANDPVKDSVTKSFYDSGWSGINIEPAVEWFEKLEEHRPRDTNLNVAAGAVQGEIAFYVVPNTGLSTYDKNLANRHSEESGYNFVEHRVHVDTLTCICERYAPPDIHFLKIDVEGGEMDVLRGLDLKHVRPWILVVESTLPNTQVQDHLKWEQIIVSQAYRFVYFDGLNRFYLADEHQELESAFKSPPNFFDQFKSANEAWLAEHAAWLEGEWEIAKMRVGELSGLLGELGDELSKAQRQIETLSKSISQREAASRLLSTQLEAEQHEAYRWWRQAEAYEAELRQVYCSNSWRLTYPLRAGSHGLRTLSLRATKATKKVARTLIFRAAGLVRKNAKMKKLVLRAIRVFPRVQVWAHRLVHPHNVPDWQMADPLRMSRLGAGHGKRLTPEAQRIYADINSAIAVDKEVH